MKSVGGTMFAAYGWLLSHAAVVIAAVIELVDIPALVQLYRTYTRGLGRPNVKTVALDAETIPSIDVTAGNMLIELGHDLQRQGKRLVLARQVRQVRDMLATERAPTAIESYPSMRAAVDALRAESQTGRER